MPCADDANTLGGSLEWSQSSWVDPLTGLEWQIKCKEAMTWHQARDYAAGLRLKGHADWRLPELRELESLLDRSVYRPEIRSEVPFQDRRSFWTATTFAKDTDNAWIVMFEGAYVLSYLKQNRYAVRCVRGRFKVRDSQ
ncbi:MAG: DUF1566 domain-containing protein [Desulfohalobiaceae bacterium]|nr:DUF1566 domain-containing protein [Desulfohalobiaceae bacterium]